MTHKLVWTTQLVAQIVGSLLSLAWVNAGWAIEPYRQDAGPDGVVAIELENHEATYSYSQLVVFGDSLSDSGNLFALTGGALPADPPYDRGRYSNGIVWVEYAAADMHIALDNHAYGSALSGYDNLDGSYPGMRTQIDAYVANNADGADPSALYVVWVGANDFFNLSDFSEIAVSAAIGDAVYNITTAVSQLASIGAQHIVVGALPDLGLVPYASSAQALASPSTLTAASTEFNNRLVSSLAGTGIATIMLDSQEILNRIVGSGANYNLSNVDDRCAQISGTVCSAPDAYLFWDDRHPTTQGHRIFADQFLGLVSDASVATHAWTTAYPPGASNGASVEANPNADARVNVGYVTNSPRLDFRVDFQHTGVHYVWIRGMAGSFRDDSLHVGLNGAAVSTADRLTGFGPSWTWSKGTMDSAVAQINVPAPGEHTVNVWMREDGLIADKLVLTKAADYSPSGTGPTESTRGPPLPRVGTPMISPAGGTHVGPVTVNLSTATPGAALHYTTNGTTPTALSMQYTGPVTIASSSTVRVVGIRSDYADSEIASASFQVVSGSTDGDLSGGAVAGLSSADLTSNGGLDWVHYGRGSRTDVNRKAGVSARIGPLVVTGNSNRYVSGNRTQLAWNDGAPVGAETGTGAGLYVSGSGNGFELDIAADESQRTVRLYVGGYRTRGRLEATLSDGSVAPYVVTFENLNAAFDREVSLTFRAGSDGQTLRVRYTQDIGTGNVTFAAAALEGEQSTIFSLPHTETFDSPTADWVFVNESNRPSDWRVINGFLRQLERVESTATFVDSYHLGTYAYLSSAFGLTDYRVSVTAEAIDSEYPEDLGLMVRYRDPNNYYRLSLNTRYGFTRLEKRVDGIFQTLAVNSTGYELVGSTKMTIELIGTSIMVALDGQPVFAIEDEDIRSGTIAMYTQESARFDDLQIDAAETASRVRISAPTTDFVTPGDSLSVHALVVNAPTLAKVELSLEGTAPVELTTPPFRHSFDGLVAGRYSLTARLLDSSGAEIDVDHRTNIGVLGNYILGVGDSNTNGIGDNYASDNLSAYDRVRASQGYEANLGALLKGMPPYEIAIFNEGIGGDTSERVLTDRIGSILERHSASSTALLMLGTNDAGGSLPVRSGLACAPADSACLDGTFRERMQDLVNVLSANGLGVWVATAPPSFGAPNPWTANRNETIREYNRVVREHLAGISLGPDVFDFILRDANGDAVAEHNLSSIFADSLHFNGLGHSVLAQLWYNALVGDASGTSVTPFVLSLLRSSTSAPLQQNLLEAGDMVWLDSGDTLTSLPESFFDAIWVMTPQDDVSNSDASYLTFTISQNCDIYVAYDGDVADADLPSWLSPATSTFSEVAGVSIETTSVQAGAMRVFVRNGVAANSIVELGGNQGGTTGADSMYIVMVKPR